MGNLDPDNRELSLEDQAKVTGGSAAPLHLVDTESQRLLDKVGAPALALDLELGEDNRPGPRQTDRH